MYHTVVGFPYALKVVNYGIVYDLLTIKPTGNSAETIQTVLALHVLT